MNATIIICLLKCVLKNILASAYKRTWTSVLLFSDCHNKYHRLGCLNNKHLLLTAQKARNRMIRALFLVSSYGWERATSLQSHLFNMGTNPITESPPSWSNYFWKALYSNTMTIDIRVSTYKFCGDTNIQYISVSQQMFIEWLL